MKKMKRVIAGVLFLCAAVALRAQTLKTLVTFNQTDGEDVFSSFIEGKDGNLYGTTVYGGNSNFGTFFRISPQGIHTVLYNFCAQTNCTDGSYPEWLTQSSDGDFYGETYNGGSVGAGTVFKITSSGKLTTLYSFCTKTGCTDGALPQSALVQTSDGNLYGTTVIGGAQNQGTVFKLTTSGVLTTLYNFCSKTNCVDGAQPNIGLTLARNGSFYGTAALGGNSSPMCSYRCGTLFRITANGKFTTIYRFCGQAGCADGSIPQGLLVQARHGSLYGTTDGGGANGLGTVYRISLRGKLTTVHSFCTGSCADGGIPYAGLIQATDGNFYGTANIGGPGGRGTVYKMTAAGAVTPLYGFDGQADGAFPAAGVIQGKDGRLYGGTEEGGDDSCDYPNGCGVVFRLSTKTATGSAADHPAAVVSSGLPVWSPFTNSPPPAVPRRIAAGASPR